MSNQNNKNRKQPISITFNNMDEEQKLNREFDEYSNFIIETNKKLQLENVNLRVKLTEKEQEKINQQNLSEKDLEDKEDEIDKMEKQIICLKGWLHNLNYIKTEVEKNNKKYKIINSEVIKFFNDFKDYFNELYKNVKLVCLFVLIFQLFLFILNIINFNSLITMVFTEFIWFGLLAFLVNIIISKSDLIKQLDDFEKKKCKYKNMLLQIEKVEIEVKKVLEKCIEIDKIIDDI